MDECLILVDNSNVFIEGRKFAARNKGLVKQSDDQYDPVDWSWRIDFGSLLKQVANGHKIIKAILVGSTPPPNDSLWNAAKSQGFEVITHERSHSTGEEKAVDTELVARGLKIIYKHPAPAILKLLSGDRDFLPLIRSAYE
ncbi:MAG: NYN domain-containing protein, partial [Spirochaetales bacterium]|nr:NYN domain-containing protein [Spirochaetales bacterium]